MSGSAEPDTPKWRLGGLKGPIVLAYLGAFVWVIGGGFPVMLPSPRGVVAGALLAAAGVLTFVRFHRAAEDYRRLECRAAREGLSNRLAASQGATGFHYLVLGASALLLIAVGGFIVLHSL